MDYKSYKAMCDSTLQEIRKSENKREELSDKLQKMYQEKSECEKSIIKTLQSQQQQFTMEKRRREERNESILRSLERIDYQAQLLAAKTERLRALKRQYERYLLSLWTTRRIAVYPIGNQLTSNFVKPFTAKYDESSIHQSSYYNTNRSTFATDLRTSNYQQAYPVLNDGNTFASNSNITSSHTPQYNQSHYSRVLLTPASMAVSSASAVSENSIKAGNYLMTSTTPTTGAVVDVDSKLQFSYPSSSSSILSHSQVPVARFMGDLPSETAQHFPMPSSTVTGCYPIYQYNSKPLEIQNNNNSNYNNSVRMSKSLYGSNDNINPLIMPAEIPSSTSPQQQPLSSFQIENRLKNELEFDAMNKASPLSTSMAVADSDESFNEIRKNNAIRRNSQLEIPKIEMNENSVQLRRKSIEKSDYPLTSFGNAENQNFSAAVALDHTDGNMHQVWEKVIETELLTPTTTTALDAHEDEEKQQQNTSFVIPKIIVETQFDMAEAKATTIMAYSPEDIKTATTASSSIVDVDRDTPEKLLNQKMEKHSSDNSDSAATALAYDNNSPVMEVESSIYHYGKQQKQQSGRIADSDEQQHMNVEHELQKLNDIKISGEVIAIPDVEGVTMTRENDRNNFQVGEKINDDNENQQQQQTHSFNEKVSEIYQKIQKIEGEYYDEKEKIIENFEKRMSSSSPIPDASPTTAVEIEEISSIIIDDEFANNQANIQSEFKLEPELHQTQVDGTQFNYDHRHQVKEDERYKEDEKQTLNEVEYVEEVPAGPQPMFDNNQYASTASKDDDNVFIDDGGELQANFVEYPSSSTEMQYQQHQDYYGNDATGFEQPNSGSVALENYDYTQYEQQHEQLDSNYQQNNNYETTENLSNYNDTSALYYDPNIATSTINAADTNYDDQNYSNQQSMMPYHTNEDTSQMNDYFYQQQQQQQQFYDNNNEIYPQELSSESNYYKNEQRGEIIETSNAPYVMDDGSYGNVEYDESQLLEQQQQQQYEYIPENFENNQNYATSLATHADVAADDESYLVTASSTSSEFSKPFVDMEMSGGGGSGETAIASNTKREDVKLVKQLLDSESDDATSRSNLLSTAIKEEEKEDESDFDFSTN